MAKGLYGQDQGNEKRGAVERFAAQLADNTVAEADVVEQLHALWHFGATESLVNVFDAIRAEWLAAGPEDEKEAAAYRQRAELRLQSVLTRATYDTPNALKFRGGTFAYGAKIKQPELAGGTESIK